MLVRDEGDLVKDSLHHLIFQSTCTPAKISISIKVQNV